MKSNNLIASTITFVFFVIAYLYGQYIGYWPVFYEDQFIHGAFLEDVTNGVFNWRNVFTVFGEHLFPGYTVLAYINYKLFGVSLAFEYVLTLFVNIIAAGYIFIIFRRFGIRGILFTVFVSIILLSPVQYPMKSMALVASISVIYLIFMFDLLINFGKRNFFLLSIPLYVLFLGGAYSAGFVVSILFYMILFERDKLFIAKILLICASSFAVYYLILVSQGSVSSVHEHVINLVASLNFASIMLGSSLMGKAFFESTHSLTFYYISALTLFLVAIYVIRVSFLDAINNCQKFILVCLVYSFSIVAIASYARYQNGIDLAMGQWYQSHIKYIPVFLVGYFFVSSRTKRTYCNVLAIFFTAIALLGYIYEYKKLPYARDWRKQVADTSITLLMNQNVSFDDMNVGRFYWPDGWARKSLTLFYKNKLAYFRGPVVNGLEHDNWVLEGVPLEILCPYSTNLIDLDVDAGALPASALPEGCSSSKVSGNDHIHIQCNFRGEFSFVKFPNAPVGSGLNINSADHRRLSYHLKSFKCE